MIQAVLVFNNHGKPRLIKFYKHFTESKQQQLLLDIFQLVSQRTSDSCNFIEKNNAILGESYKIMYRHFTTLFFVFCCDDSESELAILDLIQVFVEALDKCFKNVCELDLIFHMDRAHFILNEMVLGGVVLETNITEILAKYEEQMEVEARENRIAPAIAMPSLPSIPSALSNHLPNLKDFKMPDLAYSVRDIGGL